MRFQITFILVAAFSSHALAKIPQSMSALGDSISTATLAQYKRSQAMSPLAHLGVTVEFLKFAFHKDKLQLSDWRYSWTTGLGSQKVLSHAGRLLQANPQLSVSNFAEPGARVDQVWQSQIPNLRAWSQEAYGTNYPDYITIMVGINDICAETLELSTSHSSYLRSYQKILREILSQSSTTKVLVASLPPYQDLKKSADAFYLAFPKMHNCQALWEIAPLCKSITHGDEENTLRVEQKVAQFNSGLRALVARLRKNYGDRVRFADKVSQRSISADDLSIDCFHPTAKAQNDLAELSWSSTWWAKK